jgi:hypothetical protein
MYVVLVKMYLALKTELEVYLREDLVSLLFYI